MDDVLAAFQGLRIGDGACIQVSDIINEVELGYQVSALEKKGLVVTIGDGWLTIDNIEE